VGVCTSLLACCSFTKLKYLEHRCQCLYVLFCVHIHTYNGLKLWLRQTATAAPILAATGPTLACMAPTSLVFICIAILNNSRITPKSSHIDEYNLVNGSKFYSEFGLIHDVFTIDCQSINNETPFFDRSSSILKWNDFYLQRRKRCMCAYK
jgi:hypothetical protein